MDEQGVPHDVEHETRQLISKALGRLPQSVFLLTAAHEHRQRGVMVSWVQQVSFEPPMIMFALNKSLQIGPFLHESRAFALNQIAADDKLTPRRFGFDLTVKQDAFETLELRRLTTGSPVLARALTCFDCELVRHFDIEGDHDISVGRIVDAAVLHEGDPPVRFREDGFAY
jgi:flavin reductase (DIM6/NTAB) family NADH-FMN oxidoreductase RutF